MEITQPIDLEFSMNLEGTAFPLADANGNAVTYVDDAGNVQAHYVYDAFGGIVSQSGDMDDDFHFRFSSKYLDDETGFYYYGYRYYDPDTGRWLSRDPIGEDGGLMLYGFVGNDAVEYIDVLGFGFFPGDPYGDPDDRDYGDGDYWNNPDAGIDAATGHGGPLACPFCECNEGEKQIFINKEYKCRTGTPNGVDSGHNECGKRGSKFRPPQSFLGIVDFAPICNDHDDCYGECGKGKLNCDNAFRKGLRSACKKDIPWYRFITRASCYAAADAYYAAVLVGGSGAYATTQNAVCVISPCR